MTKALIIGANGQDASYLAEFLDNKGYDLYGTIRRNSVPESQTTRIQALYDQNKIKLVYADLLDKSSIDFVIRSIMPDEIYHLAAQSHVRISYNLPKYTVDVNCGGTVNILEATRTYCPTAKVYNAASSEMFGNSIDNDMYQRITTPMTPVSPYGCSKLFAYNICHNYRNAYNMFIVSGILFNHESPRRGINFVTNKIVTEAVNIKKGLKNQIVLGNLEAYRDWGHAKDYIEAMWLMMQQQSPNDYVVATGVSRQVKYVLEYVFDYLKLDYTKYLVLDSQYERPEELDFLRGYSQPAKDSLNWTPKYTLETLLEEMINYAMEAH